MASRRMWPTEKKKKRENGNKENQFLIREGTWVSIGTGASKRAGCIDLVGDDGTVMVHLLEDSQYYRASDGRLRPCTNQTPRGSFVELRTADLRALSSF